MLDDDTTLIGELIATIQRTGAPLTSAQLYDITGHGRDKISQALGNAWRRDTLIRGKVRNPEAGRGQGVRDWAWAYWPGNAWPVGCATLEPPERSGKAIAPREAVTTATPMVAPPNGTAIPAPIAPASEATPEEDVAPIPFPELDPERPDLYLQHYNHWRRGDVTYQQPNPTELGRAIDLAISALQTYRDGYYDLLREVEQLRATTAPATLPDGLQVRASGVRIELPASSMWHGGATLRIDTGDNADIAITPQSLAAIALAARTLQPLL